VYSGDTSSPSYVVEIHKINLRSGRVLSDNQTTPPPRESEGEREVSMPRMNPPLFPKILTQLVEPTPKENELLGELKNLCVKNPLLQPSRMYLFTTSLLKRSVSEEKKRYPYH